MPYVLSIHTNFIQSHPVIQNELEFAKLLSDVGNNALQSEALALLETGDSICTALLDLRPKRRPSSIGRYSGSPTSLVTVTWCRRETQSSRNQQAYH